VRALQRDCPMRVIGVHSSGVQKAIFELSDAPEKADWPMATESTHASFDRLFRAIREKELIFHRMAILGLPPHPEDAALQAAFSHINNVAKVVRTETKTGRQVQMSCIYVPRGPVKTHPIHYATAATKLLHAIRLHFEGYGATLAGIVIPSEGLLTFRQKDQ